MVATWCKARARRSSNSTIWLCNCCLMELDMHRTAQGHHRWGARKFCVERTKTPSQPEDVGVLLLASHLGKTRRSQSCYSVDAFVTTEHFSKLWPLYTPLVKPLAGSPERVHKSRNPHFSVWRETEAWTNPRPSAPGAPGREKGCQKKVRNPESRT